MTNMQVAVGAGTVAVLVLALGLLVWRLHGEVRRLGAEVTALRSGTVPEVSQPQPVVVEPREPLAEEGRRPVPVAEDDRPVVSTASTTEPVPVITGLTKDQPAVGAEPSAARIASVTLGPPLIKIAAFSYGVRRALSEEQRMRVSYAVRKELRRQHKLRRRRRRSAMASEGGRP